MSDTLTQILAAKQTRLSRGEFTSTAPAPLADGRSAFRALLA